MAWTEFLKTRRDRRPPPAHTYIALYIAAGVILFTVIAMVMLERMHEVRELVAREHQQAARQEVQRAVDHSLREIRDYGRELADWNEVRQQLADPSYYVYWREQRLQASKKFPAWVEAIELYDANGNPLAASTQRDLPVDHVPMEPEFLRHADDRLELLIAFAVERPGTASPQGYLALQVEFIDALRALNRFASTRPDSIHLPVPDRPVTTGRLADQLAYEPMPGLQGDRLERVMLHTLLELGALLAVLVAVFFWGMRRLFSQPLVRLAHQIEVLRSGTEGPDARGCQPLPVRELETVRSSLMDYQHRLDRIHADLDRKNRELWSMAHRDPLTEAFNRRAFDEDWGELQRLMRNQRIDVSLLLFDCDFFKAINDSYGHEVGDQVIRAMAMAIREGLRRGDRLYRLGGDEFATILLNTDRALAEKVAQRCQECINAHPFAELGIREPVRSSIGVASSRADAPADLAALPRQADLAMYEAKRTRHKRPVHYHPGMDDDSGGLTSTCVVNAVLEAVGAGPGMGDMPVRQEAARRYGRGLRMHYQPVTDTRLGRPAYYEALARIHCDACAQLLRPGDFMPVLRRRDMEMELDDAVIAAVADDLASGGFPADTGVSVNLCAASVMRPDLVDCLDPLHPFLEHFRIVLEVTETTLVTHMQTASANLQALRKKGFLVALDDFGNGYSSLGYLANMPVDLVKFDLSMTRAFEHDPQSRIIIRGALGMVREAGYEVVFEGIETQATQRHIAELGVYRMQGFRFGHPRPLEQLGDTGERT